MSNISSRDYLFNYPNSVRHLFIVASSVRIHKSGFNAKAIIQMIFHSYFPFKIGKPTLEKGFERDFEIANKYRDSLGLMIQTEILLSHSKIA